MSAVRPPHPLIALVSIGLQHVDFDGVVLAVRDALHVGVGQRTVMARRAFSVSSWWPLIWISSAGFDASLWERGLRSRTYSWAESFGIVRPPYRKL